MLNERLTITLNDKWLQWTALAACGTGCMHFDVIDRFPSILFTLAIYQVNQG